MTPTPLCPRALREQEPPPSGQGPEVGVKRRPSSPEPESSPAVPAAEKKYGAVVAGTVALVAVAALIMVLVVVLNRPDNGPASSASAGAACSQYAVTAETLSLRSEDGTSLGKEYFTKGQVLTVVTRNGGKGYKYWYVVGDDGRRAWILPSSWIHALC